MNLRKFYLILFFIVCFFLFTSGVSILAYLDNNTPPKQEDEVIEKVVTHSEKKNSIISEILAPLKKEKEYVEKILTPFKKEKEPFNLLVLGGNMVTGNTDVIMLLNFNPSTSKLNILSIPRDTKVQINGSSVPKINSAYPAGGASLAISTVSNLLNVNIKYYMYIDTSSLRQIIDLLGGVEYYIPADMDYDDPSQNLHIHFKKGQQHLNGEQAEQLMRFKQPQSNTKEVKQVYDSNDLKKIEIQQNLIRAILSQKTNIFNVGKSRDIISLVFNNIETNLPLVEALKLSNNVAKFDSNTISIFKLPGEPQGDNNGWYYIYNKAATDAIIKQYFSINNISNNSGNTTKPTGKPNTQKEPTKSIGTTNNSTTTKNNTTNTVTTNTANGPSNSETSAKDSTTKKP